MALMHVGGWIWDASRLEEAWGGGAHIWRTKDETKGRRILCEPEQRGAPMILWNLVAAKTPTGSPAGKGCSELVLVFTPYSNWIVELLQTFLTVPS